MTYIGIHSSTLISPSFGFQGGSLSTKILFSPGCPTLLDKEGARDWRITLGVCSEPSEPMAHLRVHILQVKKHCPNAHHIWLLQLYVSFCQFWTKEYWTIIIFCKLIQPIGGIKLNSAPNLSPGMSHCDKFGPFVDVWSKFTLYKY